MISAAEEMEYVMVRIKFILKRLFYLVLSFFYSLHVEVLVSTCFAWSSTFAVSHEPSKIRKKLKDIQTF